MHPKEDSSPVHRCDYIDIRMTSIKPPEVAYKIYKEYFDRYKDDLSHGVDNYTNKDDPSRGVDNYTNKYALQEMGQVCMILYLKKKSVFSGEEAKTFLKESLFFWMKLNGLEPRRAKTTHMIADLYFQLGDFENAERFYHLDQELEPDRMLTLINLGNIALRRNDVNMAKEYYQQALNRHPNDPQITFLLNNLAAAKDGANPARFEHIDIVKASKLLPPQESHLKLKQAFSADPGLFQNAYAVEEMAHKSFALYKLHKDKDKIAGGHLNDAYTYFTQLNKLAPNISKTLSMLGNVCIKKRLFKEAEEYYLKVIKISPNEQHIYLSLSFLAHNKGDLALSLQYLEKAHKLEPHNTKTNTLLTKVRAELAAKKV
jgi:tetratricopeptide (TPR) repeat protein